MGDDCRGCRNWEEEIYWSRFQSVQFFQTLSGGRYHQELVILITLMSFMLCFLRDF